MTAQPYMRRRQAFAAESARLALERASVLHQPSPEIADRPLAEQLPAPVKGRCPKCGRDFPRALHFHVRSCRGHAR